MTHKSAAPDKILQVTLASANIDVKFSSSDNKPMQLNLFHYVSITDLYFIH